MAVIEEFFTLSNGVKIGKIGLGTWQAKGEPVYGAIGSSLDCGYRHIDTAYMYDNQVEVGQAIHAYPLERQEIFVTSKIPAGVKSYQEAKENIEAILSQLQMDYIDLLLIHWPRPFEFMRENPENKTFYQENLQVWKAMEEAYEAGKVRAIGVSNFSIDDLKNLMEHGKVKPMVNQIVYHIGKTNPELLEFCQSNDILVEGYSPIATGKLLDDQRIKEIAEKYQASVPQLCIRYLLEKDILPLPKSVHAQYIKENAQVDFQISSQDMAYLDSLG